MFDPATLRNTPVDVAVGKRELVRGIATPIPAFRVEMEFAGLHTTSWVTDTGEVVREESPLGLITVRESAENARAMAVSRRMQVDLLQAAAVVPRMQTRIAEARDVRRLRMRLDGADLVEPRSAGRRPARRRGHRGAVGSAESAAGARRSRCGAVPRA